MIIFLIAIPILTILSGVSLYKFNGKREFLKFDFVQFVYAFIIAPMVFVWMKSFFLVLFRSELGLNLSLSELFIIDSLFSLLFIYIFAFVVIHSLTKSFQVRMEVDPQYDMFTHSEYFHLWLSHIAMFTGGVIGITAFSFINLALPIDINLPRFVMPGAFVTGIIIGIGVYIGAVLSNPMQRNFLRIIKLLFGAGFLAHVVSYYLLQPRVHPQYMLYWIIFTMFTTFVVCSLLFQRSSRVRAFINSLKGKGWGNNIQLTEIKK